MFFIALPVLSIGTMLAYFKIAISREVGELSIMLVGCYAPYNSFLTLFFVTPYRNYTKELILQMMNLLIRRIGGIFGFEVNVRRMTLKRSTEIVRRLTIVRGKTLPIK